MHSFRFVELAGSLLVLSVAAAPLLAGQSVERTAPGRISVRAEGQPLDELLLELNKVIEFEMLLVDRSIEKRSVTITLEDEPITDALWEIMDAAKVNAIVWGEEGKRYRLFAGSPTLTTNPGREVRSLLEVNEEDSAPPVAPEGRPSPPPVAPESRPSPSVVAPESSPSPPPVAPESRPSPPVAAPDNVRPRVPPRRASGDARLREAPDGPRLWNVGSVLAAGLLAGSFLVGRRRWPMA